ncbi:MAG: HAMP domain-containing histidine kinase [Oscillospiraceae bacterium]|nr:HAMP domain-containing histidine kinase [Oscillospiraceae bacterium]
MRARYWMTIGAFLLLLVLVSALALQMIGTADPAEQQAEQVVFINELHQLIRAGELEKANAATESYLNESNRQAVSRQALLLLGAGCIAILLAAALVLYMTVLRPFHKLETFAARIATGDFDLPLQVDRSNYFGAFTWAFDCMRREIKNARENEARAVEQNKTVIATLSHDIKTPIASILTYAEGLEANMDASPERRARYLSVIMRKCSEVAKLTDDLFLHAISDMDRLSVNCETLELTAFVEEAARELDAARGELCLSAPGFQAEIAADPKRLLQILENLVANARKYAKSKMDLRLELHGDTVLLRFRDYGPGIPDADLPFVFDRFYRGANVGKEAGSGLGLFIVEYLTEAMHGRVQIENLSDGCCVTLAFPILPQMEDAEKTAYPRLS